MNLYRYYRVYSYGDCEDEYLVYANSIEEAQEKIIIYKTNMGALNLDVKIGDIELVNFKNDIAEII